MNPLRRFTRLEPYRRGLFLTAFMLLFAVRIALWTVPFVTLQRILRRFSRPSARAVPTDSQTVDAIGWAVETAARYVPKAHCLPQALTAQVLLARRGLPATFRLGVRRGGGGRFEAHAWVECHGRVIVGGTDVHARYARLPDVKWDAR